MCIILTCNPNKRPTYEMLKTCMYNNPDGAGIMWIENSRVQVSKGYATVYELNKAIQATPTNSPLVIHARIGTSGGYDASVCHPFPITSNIEALHALDVECKAAIAHNGVIANMPTDSKTGISDTVAFIRDYLAPQWAGKATRQTRRLLRIKAKTSRFAILTNNGKLTRHGNGWRYVSDGIYASNDSYIAYKTWYPSYHGSYSTWTWWDSTVIDSPTCKACSDYTECLMYGRICPLPTTKQPMHY